MVAKTQKEQPASTGKSALDAKRAATAKITKTGKQKKTNPEKEAAASLADMLTDAPSKSAANGDAVTAPIKRRKKPGQAVLKMIRDLQKTVDPQLKMAPMNRLVDEIVQQRLDRESAEKRKFNITREARLALVVGADAFLTRYIKEAYLLAIQNKRITLKPIDYQTRHMLFNIESPDVCKIIANETLEVRQQDAEARRRKRQARYERRAAGYVERAEVIDGGDAADESDEEQPKKKKGGSKKKKAAEEAPAKEKTAKAKSSGKKKKAPAKEVEMSDAASSDTE